MALFQLTTNPWKLTTSIRPLQQIVLGILKISSINLGVSEVTLITVSLWKIPIWLTVIRWSLITSAPCSRWWGLYILWSDTEVFTPMQPQEPSEEVSLVYLTSYSE